MGDITVTLDHWAVRTNRGAHLKISKDDVEEEIYPELPDHKKAMYDAKHPISIGFRDPNLVFVAQMVLKPKHGKSYCALGEGIWWDYAHRKGLTVDSTLTLRYIPSLDELHVVD